MGFGGNDFGFLGHILPTGLVMGYGVMAGRLWTTVPKVPTSHPSHNLAGKVFARDADKKQSVTSWLQKLDTDFFMLGYMPLCHSGTIRKHQW